MTKPTRAWPHLDDAEYDRRVAALTAAANALRSEDGIWRFWPALWSLTLEALKPKKRTAIQVWQVCTELVSLPVEDLAKSFTSSLVDSRELIHNTTPETRVAMALNPFTPQNLLKILLWDERFYDDWAYSGLCLWGIGMDTQIRCKDAAALNAFLEPENFDEIFQTDQDEFAPQQICILAHNPALPLNLLEKLASNSDDEIRASIAHNPVVPLVIIKELANDDHELVRMSVADNPWTPVATLEKLAEDEDEDVREAVAKNPRKPLNSGGGFGEFGRGRRRGCAPGRGRKPIHPGDDVGVVGS
jgi:hypothetical protein